MGFNNIQEIGVSAGAIQNATHTYAADAEASDAYVITLTPAVSAYAEGQEFVFKANTANTGASSLNVNGLGAKTLKKNTDQDTETGDIESGSILSVVYDGTNFQIVSTSAGTTIDHGGLLGLADDDHSQYLLANGTRALGGAWDMGSQNLTNVDIDSGTLDGITTLQMPSGDIGATGARITKGWFTDLEATNAIAGSITGNAATVTTNANLTGTVTSTGNATSIASGAIAANMLQSAAADMGAANVTIDLGNTNGAYVTNVTTDGSITATAGFVGNVTGNVSGSSGSCSGNAATVTTNANLTGVVTSVGNATAIADKALSIAKLADGTDGELITWDATGVITTVAAGTATQVLTSNGAGAAPTFQNAAAGGQTLYDATAGATGADYTTLKGAIDAGKVNIVVINSTTEAADIALTATTNITIMSGAVVDMGAYQFTYAATQNVRIVGEGTMKWTHAGVTTLFGVGTGETASIIQIDGVTMDNTSTSHGAAICPDSYGDLRISNCQVNIPGYATCGIRTNKDSAFAHNIVFNLTSTSATNFVMIDAGTASGISTIGSSATGTLGRASGYAVASGLNFGSCNLASTFEVSQGHVSNIATDGTISFAGANSNVTGGRCYRVYNNSSNDCSVSNIDAQILDINSGVDNMTITGGRYYATSDIEGNNVKCIGVEFATLAVDALANDLVLVACDFTAALNDSGTNTVVLGKNPSWSTEVSSATPTINVNLVEAHSITALATAVTSMTTNLSGSPRNFQKLTIRFKDDGTARAIAWGPSFEDAGQALPTTTVISKLLTAGLIYNSVSSKFGCVAVANET